MLPHLLIEEPMTRISLANMQIDPRSNYDKLSRSDVRKILSAKGIKYDPRIKKVDGIKIMQANGIDPMEAIEWEQVHIQDANGNVKIKMEPKRTPPERPDGYDEKALAKVEQLSAQAIKKENDQKEKVKSLESEVSDLKDLVKQLLAEREESNLKEAIVEEVKVKEVDPVKVHWKTFQKMAKEAGLEWKPKEPREPIIEKLNG